MHHVRFHEVHISHQGCSEIEHRERRRRSVYSAGHGADVSPLAR